MEIKNKTALVTGAAKRVGREIALAFARKGANVLIHFHRSKNEALETCEAIRSLGVESLTFQADLKRVGDIKKMTDEINRRAGGVDILVNSASLFYKTPLESVKEPDWDALVDVNLKGPFFLSQATGARMQKNKGGSILNIADWSGFRPYRDFAPYCSAKGGLITLTKSLARDLAPEVRVNAVAPGPVLLPPDISEEEAKTIAGLTALGRIGSPTDVANAAVFLAENDFINGTVLVVDGGRSIV